MYCPGGNVTDPISWVLASSQGISFWTPFKPQRSNPNPNPLANQIWCSDFLTLLTPLIIPNWLSAFLESLMSHKNWCSIHARCSKSSLKHSICFCGIFPSFFIIMSCHRHGNPWPSLVTSPYRSSTLAGLQGYVPYPHIVAGCILGLVVLLFQFKT